MSRDPSYADNGRVLKQLIQQKAFRLFPEGQEVTLASGKKSRVYFNLKPVLLQGQGLDLVCLAAAEALADLREEGVTFNAFAGVLDGGAPLAAALGLYYWVEEGADIPMLLVRKQAKEHGLKGLIMGSENVPTGSEVLVLEDVTTTGGSLLRAVAALRENGYCCSYALTVLDREEGAVEALAAEGVELLSLFRKTHFMDEEGGVS